MTVLKIKPFLDLYCENICLFVTPFAYYFSETIPINHYCKIRQYRGSKTTGSNLYNNRMSFGYKQHLYTISVRPIPLIITVKVDIIEETKPQVLTYTTTGSR